MTYRQNKGSRNRRSSDAKEKDDAGKRIEMALHRNDEMRGEENWEKSYENLNRAEAAEVNQRNRGGTRDNLGRRGQNLNFRDEYNEHAYEDAEREYMERDQNKEDKDRKAGAEVKEHRREDS